MRIRHDDPKLEPYAPRAALIGSAMQLASDELGLPGLAVVATVGEWYQVDVADLVGSPTVKRRRR